MLERSRKDHKGCDHAIKIAITHYLVYNICAELTLVGKTNCSCQNEASCKHKLVDAIRVCQSICMRFRVTPEALF